MRGFATPKSTGLRHQTLLKSIGGSLIWFRINTCTIVYWYGRYLAYFAGLSWRFLPFLRLSPLLGAFIRRKGRVLERVGDVYPADGRNHIISIIQFCYDESLHRKKSFGWNFVLDIRRTFVIETLMRFWHQSSWSLPFSRIDKTHLDTSYGRASARWWCGNQDCETSKILHTVCRFK